MAEPLKDPQLFRPPEIDELPGGGMPRGMRPSRSELRQLIRTAVKRARRERVHGARKEIHTMSPKGPGISAEIASELSIAGGSGKVLDAGTFVNRTLLFLIEWTACRVSGMLHDLKNEFEQDNQVAVRHHTNEINMLYRDLQRSVALLGKADVPDDSAKSHLKRITIIGEKIGELRRASEGGKVRDQFVRLERCLGVILRDIENERTSLVRALSAAGSGKQV